MFHFYYDTVKTLQADTFGTFPSVFFIKGVRLIEVCKNCAMLLKINIQWLLCTVIKFHVVKEGKEAVLY